MTPTRGERNNNPGNIDHSAAFRWRGELPPDASIEKRFARFDTPHNGIRALARNLLSYYRTHGLRNIRAVVNRWAPPVENVTSAYVDHVARQMNRDPDEPLDLEDPLTLAQLTRAIIVHENGRCLYSEPAIADAIMDALEAKLPTPARNDPVSPAKPESPPAAERAATPAAAAPSPDVPTDPSGVDDTEGFVLRGLRSIFGPPGRAPDPSPVPFTSEASMPLPAIAAALLPVLIDRVPDLIRIFGDKDKPVAERNQEAVEKVFEIAKAATGAPNEQAAVEAIATDPDAAGAFREQVRAAWFDLYDPEAFAASEASRGVAREFAEQMTGGPMWRGVGFGAILFVLAIITVVGGGLMLRELLLADASEQTRGMVAGALITWVGVVLSYFFGSSASSRTKDQALSDAAKRP
jgi:hypothetical protein